MNIVYSISTIALFNVLEPFIEWWLGDRFLLDNLTFIIILLNFYLMGVHQTLKTFKEAYEHNGPSIIIAYSPCIAQGIHGGLSNQLEEQKILVDVGYNILMRYNPEEDKLVVDSKEPDFTNYSAVFERELRYRNLEIINEDEYQELYESNMKASKSRYYYYKNLEKKEG